jgi:hypothetical protein
MSLRSSAACASFPDRMSTKLYMDVHARRAVTDGLRLRGVDVITAQEDGAAELEDAELPSIGRRRVAEYR